MRLDLMICSSSSVVDDDAPLDREKMPHSSDICHSNAAIKERVIIINGLHLY